MKTIIPIVAFVAGAAFTALAVGFWAHAQTSVRQFQLMSDMHDPLRQALDDITKTFDRGETALAERKIRLLQQRWTEYLNNTGNPPEQFANEVMKLTSASTGPDVQEIAASYRTLRSMTKEPVFVDAALAMLCRGATQAEVEKARTINGPHAHTAVSIFMNDLAAGAFGKPQPIYPVGSIIVKEKKALDYWPTSQPNADEQSKANDGVGGMIKRSPGFDPSHGDWEYFYFEDATKIEAGRMTSCVQCHAGAAGTDYVFGHWAREQR